ncbi:synaptotagmin-10-like [Mytilus galloprovincialis]|uniref:synaptotagmin-10-like n=1 Tax=Mytilus galloprovincialis TaxID=29158 RepID=UPI003F7C0833
MGKNQSKYEDDHLMEEGEQVQKVQNINKIHGLARLISAKRDHQQIVAAQGWSKQDEDMRNMQILKGLFKKLDPTVMKAVGDVRGEIQISFKYDYKRHLLLVKVIKCRELRSKDLRSKMSDPYVKLEMTPDVEDAEEKRTRVYPQTNNPKFDEIFAYPLTETELINRKLVVKVMDSDLLGRDDFLGEVIIDMNTFNFRDSPIHTAWYNLNMETDLDVTGDLEVSVEFQHPSSLLVTIHGAHGLSARDDVSLADPFVKVTVPGTKLMFQTKELKNTVDPVWNETFEFEVALEELPQRYIIFHVIDKSTFGGNDSLGQVIIELMTFNPDHSLHDFFRLADLRNTERLKSKWAQHATAEEFRESLVAHASSRHPTFLFQEHTGKKIVSVSCRKAGAQGKVRIIDGIPVK